MTAIPTGTKFVGIGASVPTPENRSSQNNAFQEVYTIDDIIAEAQTDVPASSVTYDPAVSGLDATDVQSAIDDVSAATFASQRTSTTYAPTTATSGVLIIGEEYTITDYVGGIPATLSTLVGGTGYTTGTAEATSGGSGTGLTVDITAAAGIVTAVVINVPGEDYEVGDVITILNGTSNDATFVIATITGDNFLNVGASANITGDVFTAIATTPTVWTNASILDSSGVPIVVTTQVPFTVPDIAIVNISSAQIEAWYSTPVILLSGFGANEYPEFINFRIEAELTGTEATDDFVAIYSDYDPLLSIKTLRLLNGNKNVYTLSQGAVINDVNDNNLSLPLIVGEDIKMASFVGNPTSVTGTLRVIITYTVRTFGA